LLVSDSSASISGHVPPTTICWIRASLARIQMTEQLLNRANVVAILEQMSRKAVAPVNPTWLLAARAQFGNVVSPLERGGMHRSPGLLWGKNSQEHGRAIVQ
jgi:hypothetical protein